MTQYYSMHMMVILSKLYKLKIVSDMPESDVNIAWLYCSYMAHNIGTYHNKVKLSAKWDQQHTW